MNDLISVFTTLKPLLQRYRPPLSSKIDVEGSIDLWSCKPVVIDGRQRTEIYFAGLIVQKSYVGFYFMPVYVKPELKAIFAPELLKLLKGKSCFHVKQLTPELVDQIEQALQAGYYLYMECGWI